MRLPFPIEILSLVVKSIGVLGAAKRFLFFAVPICRDLLFVFPHLRVECFRFSPSFHEFVSTPRSTTEGTNDPVASSVEEKQHTCYKDQTSH